VPILESADAVVYALVGIVFLVAALGMLGYSVVAFPVNLREQGFALAVVTLVNDLLLVMIIMEVLCTVLSYLQERGTSLQPFLFIAAISATRRILANGGADERLRGHADAAAVPGGDDRPGRQRGGHPCDRSCAVPVATPARPHREERLTPRAALQSLSFPAS
jgi:uncharacterized membrane protein (DUF373 family)